MYICTRNTKGWSFSFVVTTVRLMGENLGLAKYVRIADRSNNPTLLKKNGASYTGAWQGFFDACIGFHVIIRDFQYSIRSL